MEEPEAARNIIDFYKLDTIDLRECPPTDHYRELLSRFHALASTVFPCPDEFEKLDDWMARIWGDKKEAADPQPIFHYLVFGRNLREVCIGDPKDPELLGGIAFEFYRRSACGLIPYLVVDEEQRKTGLARWMIQAAGTGLARDAKKHEVFLRAVFAETNNPRLVSPNEDSMDPRLRVEVLRRLGAKWINVPYVQPRLEKNKNRERRLLLVVFPQLSGSNDHLHSAVIRDFLAEFYLALEEEFLPEQCHRFPEDDDDFMELDEHLGDGQFRLQELPTFGESPDSDESTIFDTIIEYKIADIENDEKNRIFDHFVALYEMAFPDPNEREELRTIEKRKRLLEFPSAKVHIILIGKDLSIGGKPKVYGGFVFDYWPESQCALLLFIVVDPDCRKQGIAKRLISRARKIVARDAADRGVRAFFAETNDPNKPTGFQQPVALPEVVEALVRLGVRQVPIPYVQPRLEEGKERVTNLILLSAVNVESPQKEMDTGLIKQFLREFYCGLEETDPVSNPSRDPAQWNVDDCLNSQFATMIAKLEGDKTTLRLPLFEDQVFQFSADEAAMALHLVEDRTGLNDEKFDQTVDNDFLLYAEGILALEFQRQSPMHSHVCHKALEVRVLLPKESTFEVPLFGVVDVYTSRIDGGPEERKGETENVGNSQPPPWIGPSIVMEATLSYTQFRVSNIRVWHLAFRPAKGQYFSEYDLIRLAHLYADSQERTNLVRKIRFWPRPRGAFKPAGNACKGCKVFAACDVAPSKCIRRQCSLFDKGCLKSTIKPLETWPIYCLFCNLAGEPVASRNLLDGGTIEVDLRNYVRSETTKESDRSGRANRLGAGEPTPNSKCGEWETIFNWPNADYVSDHPDVPCYEELTNEHSVLARKLKALAGIVTGLFSHNFLSLRELREILFPTCKHQTNFIQMLRNTLFSMDIDDPILRSCRRTTGISPYLILDHAVVLHNSAVLKKVEKELNEVLDPRSEANLTLEDLETRRKELEMQLSDHYLPNVFQYETGKAIYEKGLEQRHTKERLEEARRKITALNERIADKRHARDEDSKFLLSLVVAIFTGFSAFNMVRGFVEERACAGGVRALLERGDYEYMFVSAIGVVLGAFALLAQSHSVRRWVRRFRRFLARKKKIQWHRLFK